jgi:hypothetical protein
MNTINKPTNAGQMMKSQAPVLIEAVCIVGFLFPLASISNGGRYQIDWYTIGGGGQSSGGQYVLTGTIGQPDAAYSAGGNYELLGGFWPGGPLPPSLCFVDFDDLARFVQQWLYTGSGLAADLNHDDKVNFRDYAILAGLWLEQCPSDWPLR